MKTPMSRPLTSSWESRPAGLSQLQLGVVAPAGSDPVASRTAATPTKRSSAPTCAKTSQTWNLADASVPRTHSHVMTTTMATAIVTTTGRLAASESAPTMTKR